ncbi:MAG: deoxyguanosinetriphosphate triphosphohydrolase [Verrucomicrobiia bacterium]
MIRSLTKLEELERETLAPYAQLSSETVGRRHKEPPHAFRSAFQRDRARIVHAKAFRRLEYKTQVFLNGTGDHFRTRLTHTMEVASISRSIAAALGLNQDLAEAIALAHDLGHAPVGHAGEETLNRLMKDHGGFEHNKQSLRVVERLERRYPGFDGINLSYEVLEGIDKHGLTHVKPGSQEIFPQPSLEAQIANLADDITYYSHDLDDGIDSGLLSLDQLSELPIWQETLLTVTRAYPRLRGPRLVAFTIRNLIDREVADVITTTSRNIQRAGVQSADDVRRFAKPLVTPSAEVAAANRKTRRFLYKNLYYSKTVSRLNARACRMLERLFHLFSEDPKCLPPDVRREAHKEGLPRAVCDYLSGMTDRFLIQTYRSFWPDEDASE